MSHWEERGKRGEVTLPGVPDEGRGRVLQENKAEWVGRRLAGQKLSQTHGETLLRIKGNMTFEKNVRVCLCR